MSEICSKMLKNKLLPSFLLMKSTQLDEKDKTSSGEPMMKEPTPSINSWSKWMVLELQMILLFWQRPTGKKCLIMP